MVAQRKPQELFSDAEADKSREQMMRLVKSGFAYWAGGKPKGADPLIELTPGPDSSDYINEDRR